MVLPQTPSMTNRHEGNPQRLGILIHDLFRLKRHGAGALIQDGISRTMVEQPRHGDALLQAAREDIAPLCLGVPALGVELDEVLEVEDAQDAHEIGVGDVLGAHGADSVGVDDLLAEGAAREVWALGDVEDVAEGGLVDGAAVDGPEAAEDAEEGGLAAAVGADDEEVVALLEGEGEGFDEDVAVG